MTAPLFHYDPTRKPQQKLSMTQHKRLRRTLRTMLRPSCGSARWKQAHPGATRRQRDARVQIARRLGIAANARARKEFG